jgi:hypothetical protein
MEHLHQGENDIMSMSVARRRFYLNTLIKNRKEQNSAQKGGKGKKGRKQSSIGGEGLKSAIKSGKIPMQ